MPTCRNRRERADRPRQERPGSDTRGCARHPVRASIEIPTRNRGISNMRPFLHGSLASCRCARARMPRRPAPSTHRAPPGVRRPERRVPREPGWARDAHRSTRQTGNGERRKKTVACTHATARKAAREPSGTLGSRNHRAVTTDTTCPRPTRSCCRCSSRPSSP